MQLNSSTGPHPNFYGPLSLLFPANDNIVTLTDPGFRFGRAHPDRPTHPVETQASCFGLVLPAATCHTCPPPALAATG